MSIAQFEDQRFERHAATETFSAAQGDRTTARERIGNAGITLLRLAGLSALLGLLAGAGARVYAQAPAAEAAPAQNNVATETTPAPQADQAVYQVLPPEMVQTEPSVLVIAKSSVPVDLAPPVAAAAEGGKKGKKKKKEKAPKLTPLHIEQGTLTVDGWTGKARLNYDIADLKFIYVWVPGTGTIVASNQKFPFGIEQKGAFNGNSLTLEAKGHTVQISSEKGLLKDKKPASAWVYIDSIYKGRSMYPEMGYGNATAAPYAWPGAKETPVMKGGMIAPPPLPAGMRAILAKPNCLPAGAASTTGAQPTAAACPAASGKPATPPSPASAPPVPLPGYNSGTTTAQAAPAPKVPVAR
jgi:hypothetical protein